MRFFQVFVGVILTVTSVLASPFNRFSTRDLYILNTCDDFVLGNDQNSIGKVCISISGGTLTVTYPALPSTDAYSDIHVYIGTTIPTVTSPGKLPYTFGNGYCTISADKTEATCTIPVEDSWRACNSPLYIATHASLTYSGAGQTGWGAGSCYGSSTGNCAKYWSFTTQCQCPVIYSYEPITVTYTVCQNHPKPNFLQQSRSTI